MIIHIGTEVKTIFGVVDAAGNLVKEVPIASGRIAFVGPQELAHVGQEMLQRRLQLQAEEEAAKAAQEAALKKATGQRAAEQAKAIAAQRNGQAEQKQEATDAV